MIFFHQTRTNQDGSPTGRNRALLTLGYLLTIYSTLAVVRPIAEFLRASAVLQLLVVSMFSVSGLLTLIWRYRSAGWKRMAARMVLLGGLLIVVTNIQALPEERVHFITYGLLGWLVCWSLEQSKKPSKRLLRHWLLPILFVWCAGTVDELIQWWLPMRVFDVRDILFNGIAATNGIFLFATGRKDIASAE